MTNYCQFLFFLIQLCPFISLSTYQEDQKNKCSQKKDCFFCSKIYNCQWKQNQCEYTPLQRGWLHWYDKFTSCKHQDPSFKNLTEQYCLNINSNKLPFNAAISTNKSFNNITDIFCDWSITSLSPYKEYKFIFFLHNMTKFHKNNFVLVLHYPEGSEEKRLFNNYFNKTLGIIGFSFYFHSSEININNLKDFTFKIQEVKLFSFMILIVIMISFSVIFLGCIGFIVYKNKRIQIVKQEQELKIMQDHLKKIRQILHPTQYINEKENVYAICSICLNEFETGSIVCNLICYHVFHYNCIKKWVETMFDNPKCPNCNKCLIEEKTNECISLIMNFSFNNSIVVL